MPAGRQVATAVQFTLRIAYPLVGRRVPSCATRWTGRPAGANRGARALLRRLIRGFQPFGTAGDPAQAGLADLELPAEIFRARIRAAQLISTSRWRMSR